MLNLIGVLVAFAVVIYLIRKKFNFGISLIIGSLIVGIFSLETIQPIDIARAFIQGVVYNFKEQKFDFETIELAILLTLIFILAKAMQETGAIRKLIDSLRTIFYKGGTLGVIPAVYGLMPVPGGALFSAPLIDDEGDKFKLFKNQKNFLNVWFRHIWFPIYPVSSAMLTIVDFSNINIYELISANMPAFFASIIIGLIYLNFFIKKVPKPKPIPKKNYGGLIYLLPPIIPIIVYLIFLLIFIILGLGFEDIKEFQRIIFIIGVIISIFLLYYLLKIDLKKYIEIIRRSFTLNLALAIIGIMIFRQIIEVSEVNKILANMIGGLPFHAIIIVLIIPLAMGLMTGYNLGAIALSYFLVVPFFEITGINILGLTSLIFISSLVGYLISPIHLCNVVSSDYLKTDTIRMYKMYIPSAIAMLIVQTVFVIIFFRI